MPPRRWLASIVAHAVRFMQWDSGHASLAPSMVLRDSSLRRRTLTVGGRRRWHPLPGLQQFNQKVPLPQMRRSPRNTARTCGDLQRIGRTVADGRSGTGRPCEQIWLGSSAMTALLEACRSMLRRLASHCACGVMLCADGMRARQRQRCCLCQGWTSRALQRFRRLCDTPPWQPTPGTRRSTGAAVLSLLAASCYRVRPGSQARTRSQWACFVRAMFVAAVPGWRACCRQRRPQRLRPASCSPSTHSRRGVTIG